MKKFIFVLLGLCLSVQSFAEKKVLCVDYFVHSKDVSDANCNQLRSAVISGIQKMNRLRLIDVESESSLELEADRRTSESAMSDNTARQGEMKQLGAEYILYGNVTLTEAKKVFNSDNTFSHYSGNVVFTLKIIKVEDNTVYASQEIKCDGVGDTESESFIEAINDIENEMDNFVNEYFRIEAKIEELDEVKKDKLVSCYISVGASMGINKSQRFDVFKVKVVAGRETLKEIGSITVDEVVADDLSHCKVKEGGKEILSAFQNGDDLKVLSKKQTVFKSTFRGLGF